MAESYCTKSCTDCPDREAFNCPGCRVGPGKAFGGECDISKCCVTRGLHSCESCLASSGCIKLKRRDSVAKDREYKKQREQREYSLLVRDSNLLGKGLTVLFWVLIASILEFPTQYLEQEIISEVYGLLIGITYAVTLLRLSDTSYYFKISGICRLVCAGLTFIATLPESSILAFLLALLALVPSFIAEYQEYMGYIEVTQKLDEDFSEKWGKLWYWNFAGLIGMGLGLVLAFFGSVLGALLLVMASVTTVVVSIMKAVYLRRSAKLFRSFTEENQYSV